MRVRGGKRDWEKQGGLGGGMRVLGFGLGSSGNDQVSGSFCVLP